MVSLHQMLIKINKKGARDPGIKEKGYSESGSGKFTVSEASTGHRPLTAASYIYRNIQGKKKKVKATPQVTQVSPNITSEEGLGRIKALALCITYQETGVSILFLPFFLLHFLNKILSKL